MATLSIIAAVARNGVIGNKNDLPWHLPSDLARFKNLTRGNAVLMGRVTYESILARLGKPLPDRKNFILTSRSDYTAPGCTIVSSLFEALSDVGPDEEVFVIGGARVYEAALPVASRLYLTEVDAHVAGDTFFPSWNKHGWLLEREAAQPPDAKNQYGMVFKDYVRIS